MRNAVTCIRSVEIELADPVRASAFYTKVWGLTEVARLSDSVYLRGTSSFHHVLAIHPSRGPARVRRVVFAARDKAAVDRLHQRFSATGLPSDAPGALSGAGGGYGFGFMDPAGRSFAIIADACDHSDDRMIADRPYKIAHVNLNDRTADATAQFFVDAVGFRLIDTAGNQHFLNADHPDHSSLVICQSEQNTLNHLSFELPDLESVMRGAGRMEDHGYPIEWGVGRHGCANNVFAYFAGPEEMPIEYTSEVFQIDETYTFHGRDYWAWPPGRLDQWGVTTPHTRRWKRLQTLIDFAPDAYRLSVTDSHRPLRKAGDAS